MEISFFEINTVDPELYQYAVIVSRYRGQWVFVRQAILDTFEIPAGRREKGESIEETANRELWEETGALDFFLIPVTAFHVGREKLSATRLRRDTACGMLYIAEIQKIDRLPADSEIAEVLFASRMPEKLTYPVVQPQLFAAALQYAAVTIRSATLHDAPYLQKLNCEGMGYDYPVHKTARKLAMVLSDPDSAVFIADLAGMTVGYIHLAAYEAIYSDSLKNILAIVVDDKYRGRQIGRRLLMAAERWAREQGAAGVRLVSSLDRASAALFYQACGYHLRKEQRNFVKWFDEKKE